MVPRLILIWLNQLPYTNVKTPVFIIDTSGGMPCNSAGVAMDILRKKNYEPIGVLEVPTPTAEPFFDNKYYPVGWTREILDRSYFFGKLLAMHLKKEDNRFVDLRLGRFRFSALTKYAYQYFIKGQSSSSGLIKYNAEKCNQCGVCERKCPMNAINIQNSPKPIDYNRCMFCATCIRFCPNHALMISYRTKKIPPLHTPKSRPGYIDPKRFKTLGKPKLRSGYLRLLIGMMQVRKIIKNSTNR